LNVLKILITGVAGFIGFHLVRKLLSNLQDVEIVGIDSINDYYDLSIKYARLEECGILKEQILINQITESKTFSNYKFIQAQLENKELLIKLFETEKFDYVCNLAAQAGVRYSLTNPEAYLKSNIDSFLNLLEACRFNPVKHFVFASSSSVYGLNDKLPFSTTDHTDHPVSLYAATKKSNELMAHTYSHLFGIPATGLRFFTVYGPWGRPDMALFLFAKAILENKPINVFNNGNMYRDFTYIDDITEGIKRVLLAIPGSKQKTSPKENFSPDISSAPYRIFNIGNNDPVKLLDFIEAIENELGKKAIKNFLPLQPGDVPYSRADVQSLVEVTGYCPKTQVKDGIREFIKWYKTFYNN